MTRRMIRSLAGSGYLSLATAIVLSVSATGVGGQEYPAPPEQLAQYEAPARKTILELQPFRRTQTEEYQSGQTATLISLNPNVNASFLLQIDGQSYHIDNPDPARQFIRLAEEPAGALEITAGQVKLRCELLEGTPGALQSARDSGLPFAPLCGQRLYLRNRVAGSRTNLERVTDFLRDNVWQGEEIVRLVRDTFYKDRAAIPGKLLEDDGAHGSERGPRPAAINPAYVKSAIAPIGFGVALADPDRDRLSPGAWYPVAALPGVFAGAVQPRSIDADVLNSSGANRLDSIEGRAVDYFIAFDLGRYGLGFALGTDHPRLDWSPRPRPAARIPGLPGPDGVADAAPLVRSGMVSPDHVRRTISAFTGGFKRQHGAFKYGDYATTDTGKHYGFIERGVIYSKLKTELSTIYVLDNGTVGMKKWTSEDDALLPRIMYARQNGVPLVEIDPETGDTVPGDRVTLWGPGNWSGSAKAELRTLRAGACMQEYEGRQYLIYGYFSTATPSAMARTFQAFRCSHAMLLDMNALEHTYLAVYPRTDGRLNVGHLISGMSQLDKTARDGTVIPRFLGYPDNRDLFFVYEREADG